MKLSKPGSATNRPIFFDPEQFQSLDITKFIKDCYEKMYSANLMSVCISSNKSVGELEKIAKKFKAIKNRRILPPNIKGTQPYGPLQCQKVINMSANGNPKLRIVWTFPYYGDKIIKMNLKYFVELLGNQGPKSIISYLKAEGLAVSLEVRK